MLEETYLHQSIVISGLVGTFMFFWSITLFKLRRFSSWNMGALGAGYIILLIATILFFIGVNSAIAAILVYVYKINDWSYFANALNLSPYFILIALGLYKIFELINAKVNPPINIAIEQNNVRKVRSAIKRGADVDKWFIHAITYANLDIVKLLFSYGAKVTELELMHAVDKNNIPITAYFLDFGLGVNKVVSECNGRNAAHMAAANGHINMLNFLISKGVDLNVFDNDGFLPIHTACLNKNVIPDVIQFFLDHDFQIDARTKQNQTCLLLCSELKNPDENSIQDLNNLYKQNKKIIISYLIKKGADVNAQDINGNSALFHLTKHGYLDCAKYLIDQKANINIQDSQGRSILSKLCRVKQAKDEYAKFLVTNNIDLSITDNLGNNALHESIKQNKRNIFEYIIGKCDSKIINTINKNGDTAIHFAINNEFNRLYEIKILIAKGIALKDIYFNNIPLILIAVKRKWSAPLIVEVLKQSNKKCINFRDEFGKSALLYALGQRGSDDTVMLLLEAGAKTNVVDTEGNNALHHFSNEPRGDSKLSIDIIRYIVRTEKQFIFKKENNAGLNPLSKYLEKNSDPNIVYSFIYFGGENQITTMDKNNHIFSHKTVKTILNRELNPAVELPLPQSL